MFIVDDHPVFRQGLSQLISQERGLTVCGEADSATAALESIPACRPSVAIVDLSLGDGDGLELIKNLHPLCPGLPILVLSMHDESLYAERALRAGARGYVTKHEPPSTLIAAVRRVASGEIHLSKQASDHLVHRALGASSRGHPNPVDDLSDRELQVFQCLGMGLGTRRIATRLHISVSSVESHRANIKRKLQLRDAVELVRYAVRWAESQG